MRCIALLVFSVVVLSACGDRPAYEPGTIPASLTFSVVRVTDIEVDGTYAQQEVSNVLDVGRPTPDFFDGRTAVWRFRTLFGDLIDEPGAKIEFQFGATTLSKQDPWRTQFGTEFCLVIGGNGTASAQWLNVKSPRDIQRGWDAAEVRLRLDDSGHAAHRHLGVLRVQVLLGADVVRTLTEDDFHGRSWHLYDEDGKRRRAWSLRALAEDQNGRVVSIRGRDGSSVSIKATSWADAERQPALRLDEEVLTFQWEGPKGAGHRSAGVHDVVAIQFMRDG